MEVLHVLLGITTSFILLLPDHVVEASYCFYSYYYRYYYCYYDYTSSAGTIAGAVIGGIVGLGIILFVVFGIRAAMRKKTSGVRGTVVQSQQTITVVSTIQYPSMPAPPPPYVQPGNPYPPPSYPPPQPGQMGYGYPPPANDPAYPPPPK